MRLAKGSFIQLCRKAPFSSALTFAMATACVVLALFLYTFDANDSRISTVSSDMYAPYASSQAELDQLANDQAVLICNRRSNFIFNRRHVFVERRLYRDAFERIFRRRVAVHEVRPNSFSARQVILAGALAGYELTIWQASRDPNRAGALKKVLIFSSAIVPFVELKIVEHRTSSYTISVRFLYGHDFRNLNDDSKGLAPRHGFEPRLTAPKAAVLPLDDRGTKAADACPTLILSMTRRFASMPYQSE